MDEIDWLGGADAAGMLTHLTGQVSDRKLRLFACACVRRHWQRLRWPRPREAVETAERFADGQATAAELTEVRAHAEASAMGAPEFDQFLYLAAAATTAEDPWEAAQNARENCRLNAVRESAYEAAPWENEQALNAEASERECRAQANLLRELFGNPFRPVYVEPAWRHWGDGAAAAMAREIYDSGRLGELPYLADALEDAGCADEAILRHLREPQPCGHLRGCWVLDAVLEQE
jgi:hypothetical protein